jgi:hypothetical protein
LRRRYKDKPQVVIPAVAFWKEDVVLRKLCSVPSPVIVALAQLIEQRRRDEVGVQLHSPAIAGGRKLLRERAQILVQVRLLIVNVRLRVHHSVRLDKDNPLVLSVRLKYPQDKIGIKAAPLEKANALAPAQIPQ